LETQILFVAPFADLYDTAIQVIKERLADKADRIRVVKADLGESIGVVREAVKDGILVIVSRGGTAKIIDESVQVPVVSVRISILDVMRMVAVKGKTYKKVGIAGFRNVIYGNKDISQVLGLNLVEIPVHDEAEAMEKIAKAASEGVQFIVGDAVSVRVAKRLGLDGEIITSSPEAVYASLKEALLIARIRRDEQERSAILQTLVDQSTDGIVVTDVAGCVLMINPLAEKIFGISHLDVNGKMLNKVLPGLNTEVSKVSNEYFDFVLQQSSRSYAVKRRILHIKRETIGALYTLQNVSQLQKIERSVRTKLHKKGLIAKNYINDIIGASKACQEMKRKAIKYALTESTILVTGSSGTGKELLVQSIHNASHRADGPFVAVNCAALPENLLESELFGYDDGAFTGARKGGRQGLFELAHGGTLFLDEIGEMPMVLQSRLLRVLQEKEIMHIGGDSVIPVDVRIIAATNQNLQQMVEQKTFREDLYYRLDILRIHMPTLAERKEDIPLLAREFVTKQHDLNPKITGIASEASAFLQEQSWPGNIRQLANVMERAMLLSEGEVITTKDLQGILEKSVVISEPKIKDTPILKEEVKVDELVAKAGPKATLAEIEDAALQKVLKEENYNYTRTAARLGIHRSTLWRRLHKKK